MLTCTITSPNKTEVYKNVRNITIPGISGQMQILPGHCESFFLLRKGNIILRRPNKLPKKTKPAYGMQDKIIEITRAECYIKNNTITVIL
jgi:F0F1-type ATP synthase epsilon subunit